MKKKGIKEQKINRIEEHLENYHQYKIAIKNIQVQLDNIMPSITASYELQEGSSGTFTIKSDTERFAIDRIESRRALMLHEDMAKYKSIIEAIDRAVEGLNQEEQKFIKYRYFTDHSNEETARALDYSESNIYKIREKVLNKLLHSLNAITHL